MDIIMVSDETLYLWYLFLVELKNEDTEELPSDVRLTES